MEPQTQSSAPDMQNAGVHPGVMREHFGERSHAAFTAPDWRWQLFASRYHLPPQRARQVALHCLGEARDD